MSSIFDRFAAAVKGFTKPEVTHEQKVDEAVKGAQKRQADKAEAARRKAEANKLKGLPNPESATDEQLCLIGDLNKSANFAVKQGDLLEKSNKALLDQKELIESAVEAEQKALRRLNELVNSHEEKTIAVLEAELIAEEMKHAGHQEIKALMAKSRGINRAALKDSMRKARAEAKEKSETTASETTASETTASETTAKKTVKSKEQVRWEKILTLVKGNEAHAKVAYYMTAEQAKARAAQVVAEQDNKKRTLLCNVWAVSTKLWGPIPEELKKPFVKEAVSSTTATDNDNTASTDVAQAAGENVESQNPGAQVPGQQVVVNEVSNNF